MKDWLHWWKKIRGDPDPREETPAPHHPAPAAFSARLVSHGVSSGIYRIYLRGNDLLFVQTEPGEVTKNWGTLAALLGPVGVLIGLLFNLRSRREAKKALGNINERDPEELVRENENNFRLFIPEIRDAVMEPPASFALAGKQAGRLNLFLRDGKKVKLEFAETDEMKAALTLLAPLLNATLRVNVEWDETSQRFQNKQASAAAA